MRKIQVYKIADGRLFEDKEIAEAEELALQINNKITIWVNATFPDYDSVAKAEIADAIYEDREKFIKHLRPDPA